MLMPLGQRRDYSGSERPTGSVLLLALSLAAAGCTAVGPDRQRQALQNAFVEVAAAGDRAIVERFLRADPSLLEGEARRTSSLTARVALSAAADRGQLEVVKLLLDKGARTDRAGWDAGDRWQRSALGYAAGNGNLELAQLLLDRGAKPGVADGDGTTPLHDAARRGHTAMMVLLVERGANLEAVTTDGGLTPLLEAVSNGSSLRGAAGLCALGADAGRRDKQGRDALAIARAGLASEQSGSPRPQGVAEGQRMVEFLAPGGPCERLRRSRVAGVRLNPAALAVDVDQAACESGDLYACSQAGVALDDAKGVPRDVPRAIALFHRACEAGQAFPCSREGWFYLAGSGVPRDDVRGVRLYAKACELKDAFSCGRLGEYYVAGRGVPRDLARARELLQLSCTLKDEQACQSLAKLGGAS